MHRRSADQMVRCAISDYTCIFSLGQTRGNGGPDGTEDIRPSDLDYSVEETTEKPTRVADCAAIIPS